MKLTGNYRAGFVHLVGLPNVGKSTLFNALTHHALAIITPKAQTTQEPLIGIRDLPQAQVIYIDTPGYLTPTDTLQARMLTTLRQSLTGSDIIVWVVDVQEKELAPPLTTLVQKHPGPLLLVVNKIDLVTPPSLAQQLTHYQNQIKATAILAVSAFVPSQVEQLSERILQYLPIHPPYYPPHTLTDRSTRYFVAELIRKQVLLQYQAEVPYSTYVAINTYKEEENLVRITALLIVERPTQQKILIGKKGAALKALGITARQEIEAFLHKKVFLLLQVKVVPNWRRDAKSLMKGEQV